MILTALFGRTGHDSTQPSSARRAGVDAPGAGRRGAGHAGAPRRQPLRHRRWLRRLGAAHRAGCASTGRTSLATKTGERTGDAARAELERSLERLQVDHVDLVQLHNLVEPDEWETAHANGVAALAKARDEGLTRFIGVTGHGVRIARMHLRSLERFPFDSVLFPYSYVALTDDAYRADVEELLACARPTRWRQTIKGVSAGGGGTTTTSAASPGTSR